MSRRTLKYTLLALSLSVAMAAHGADELLTKAQRLIDQKQPREAYELLVAEQPNRAGQVEFDYLLGIAALDSGKPAEAVFAFERVLAVKPDHLQARAEIGRAYVALGEYPTARKELESVKGQPVPPEVAESIQRYIDQLDKLAAGEQRRIQVYVQAGAGYDTNVSQGPSGVPLLGGGLINVAGLRVADWVGSLAAGASFSQPLEKGFSLFGLAEARMRFSLTDTFDAAAVTPSFPFPTPGGTKDVYDNSSVDANLGVSYTINAEQVSLAAAGSLYNVDHLHYRDAWGAVAQWAHTFSQRSRLTGFAQWLTINYPDDYPGNEGRDAERWSLGATYQEALIAPIQPIYYGGGYFGREGVDGDQFPSRPSYKFYGLRGGGQLRAQESVVVFANLLYEHREYTPDPAQGFFGLPVDRRDNQFYGELGAEWTFSKEWKLIPRFEYTNNASNNPTNEYNRTVVTVNVRRDFNW